MNRKSQVVRTQILQCLCEGVSQRTCERVFGVSQNTVAKLHAEVGDWAIAQMRTLRDLEIAKIQADELHAFVGAREMNVGDMVNPPECAGRSWAYLAMCADSKLIIEYHLGDQGLPDATKFMRKVAAKLKRKSSGEFAVRPHIATDGLKAYPKAVERAFGSDVDFGVLSKQYSKTDKRGNKAPGARYVGAVRLSISGDPIPADTHTSYIERQNLNLRMGNRRFTRKSNAFSKTILNHERALAMWCVYHNYCWVPRPMRPPVGPDGKRPRKWLKRLPAAIAAGVDRRLWEVGDMLALADAYTSECRLLDFGLPSPPPSDADGQVVEVEAQEVVLAPTHWVYHSHIHQTTKVHSAGCSNCRDGQGRKAGLQKSGVWLPFYSLADAIAAATELEADANSICNMCLGEYFRRGY